MTFNTIAPKLSPCNSDNIITMEPVTHATLGANKTRHYSTRRRHYQYQ